MAARLSGLNGGPASGVPGTSSAPSTTRVVIEGDSGAVRLRLDPEDTESGGSGGPEELGGPHPSLESWATSSAPASFFLDSAASKKRRKQSRPVRIPAPGGGTSSALTLSGPGGGSPLNLSKTELADSGLLFDPAHNNNNNNNGSSPSFSPLVFPLSSSSPFSGLFPGFSVPTHQTQGSAPNPTSGTPTSSSSNGSNNNNGGGGGGVVYNSSALPANRIFNPEAYCDLCNKEFCNKYFLKTHKANKHGVYTDAPPMGGVSGPALPFLPTLQQGGGYGTGGSFDGGRDAHERDSRDRERDSFCHLCRKDFCNKYFLKRHKAKIHGIPDDTPGSSENSNGVRSNPGDPGQRSKPESGDEEGELRRGGGSSGNDDEEESDGEGEEQQQKDSSSPTGPEGGDPGCACACQLCFREFASKTALRAHLAKKHGLVIPSTFPPSFLLPFAGLGGGPLIFEETGPGAGLRPADTHSPSDLDVFECSLCRRTFQTIYLLRMHKSYFHPDEREGPGPPFKFEDSGKGGKFSDPPAIKMEVTSEETDDLRRLQSMIMELNRASAAGAWSPPPPTSGSEGPSPTATAVHACPICGKEFYSPHYLTQHLTSCHPTATPPAKSESPAEGSHSAPAHAPAPTTNTQPRPKPTPQPIQCLPWSADLPADFLTPKGGGSGMKTAATDATVGQGQGKRPSPSLSRSYCTICHKELCNKYFMRTHMLKMHGISIESSTGLGGVTCDICNKELCSKYFLKVHKQNTHGIVEEGPSPPGPPLSGPSTPTPAATSTPTPIQGGVAPDSPLNNLDSLFDASGGMSPPGSEGGAGAELHTRYFAHYSEVCPICTRRFRSSKWLKSHLVADHGEEGREKWKAMHGGRRGSDPPTHAPNNTPRMTTKSNGRKAKGRSNGGGEGKGVASGNKCVLCGTTTTDIDTLKIHILKEHGEELKAGEPVVTEDGVSDPRGQGNVFLDPLNLLFQKMDGGGGASGKLYRCSYCPFTTTLLVYLYAHERTHTGLGNSNLPTGVPGTGGETTQPLSAPLRCPMCFHTFQQLEAFQQHLIGHQMSGVLAPFFAPSVPFTPDPRSALLAPSRMNGNENGGDGWATHFRPAETKEGQEDTNNETGVKGQVGSGQGERKKDLKRKRRNFQCSQCPHLRFEGRAECAAHVATCGGAHRQSTGRGRKVMRKRQFRCRTCNFHAVSYQSLLIHSKIHHSTRSASRPVEVGGAGTTPRVVLQEGETGDFILQRFFLRSTPDTEDGSTIQTSCTQGQGQGVLEPPPPLSSSSPGRGSGSPSPQPNPDCNKSGYFVPSVVYLPVRERVSGSLRVSFSLTPTP